MTEYDDGYDEDCDDNDNYEYGDYDNLSQVEELINMVAEHLGLQPSVFSLAR